MSRWGLRDLGELCDHLHTAYNSPSRRSPSSTEAPTGAGPCCQRVAAELRRARAGAASPTPVVADSESGGPRPGVRLRPLGRPK